jgi:transcription elongation factor GreB
VAEDRNYITPYGYERIQRELSWLERTERPRIVAEVAYAASLGDRSENAEYIYGKKRLREIDSRRGFLLKRLEKAELVDPIQVRADVVRFGATVVLADERGERTWRIYGEDEVDIQAGILSWRSPIARAILGKREGDSARFEAPGGFREVEILEVRYEPCPEVGVLEFELPKSGAVPPAAPPSEEADR